MTIELIYELAEDLIHTLIKREWVLQGHRLTGAFERSLKTELSKNSRTATLTGLGLSYGLMVNEGVAPDKISTRMLPGLISYFILRGVPPENAKIAALRTLKVWEKEGMSTSASSVFSRTGLRQHFLDIALSNSEIDNYLSALFDQAIEEEYSKTKTETI